MSRRRGAIPRTDRHRIQLQLILGHIRYVLDRQTAGIILNSTGDEVEQLRKLLPNPEFRECRPGVRLHAENALFDVSTTSQRGVAVLRAASQPTVQLEDGPAGADDEQQQHEPPKSRNGRFSVERRELNSVLA